MKLYGSLQNRVMENNQFVDEIKVGMGVTEYFYSDRKPYEITEVKDQRHFTMRSLDYRHVGNGEMDNNWELISNEDNPEYEMVKRGKYWYYKSVATIKTVEQDRIRVAVAGFDIDKIMEKGSQTKYFRANIGIGNAEYYYDYSF